MTEIIIGSVVLVVLIAVALYFIDLSAKARAEEKPRLRACPICGKELRIGENILAERLARSKEGKEHIVIKGCVHCLRKEAALLRDLPPAGGTAAR